MNIGSFTTSSTSCHRPRLCDTGNSLGPSLARRDCASLVLSPSAIGAHLPSTLRSSRRSNDFGNGSDAMVEVGPAPRIDMRHHVQDSMSPQDPLTGKNGNVVAGLHADRRVNLDMRVDDDHVAHLARMNVVDA